MSESSTVLTFDEQWARWQERGARHDARLARRVRLIAGVVLIVGIVLALVWLI